MKDKELISIWKSHDQKLDDILSINKDIMTELTKTKLNNTIGSMRSPMRLLLLLGIPYTLILYLITWVAFMAAGFFVVLGFGILSLIMTAIIIGYCYHLVLIRHINSSEEIIVVQKKLAELKVSSYNMIRLSIIQLPFWSICWISLEALKQSPFVYGGINLIVFLGLAYLSYWLYKKLSLEINDSTGSRFFLSGKDWEPIEKSLAILEQLKGIK